MKKNLTRLLSVLLALVLTIGVLPVSALADGWRTADSLEREQSASMAESVETQSTTAVEGFDFSIVFLDCGRKYFSVNSIKKIIDNAKAAGFNYVQLAVGNDGLRFLLDDMSLTVNGTTYTSKQVSDAIHAGNEKYYDFTTDELTQSEMDEIISYAISKEMGVIPCINTPGHMDAILSAATSLTGTNCSYNNSARTIDVTNSTAVAFTQALLEKYIAYFSGKGCEYFNMGADEYANDKYTSGSMGFGNLQSTGKYRYYVTYVNQVAALIKNAGMTPMAFNDGIYFQRDTNSGTFDTDILICYWSNGWTSYTPMPAADLASKGFKLINTHGSYYWVLGKSDWQCDATTASGFDYKEFQGGTISNPAGAMFCIWCDYPGAGTESSVLSSTADTIAAFGATLPETDPVIMTPAFRITGDSHTLELEKEMTLSVGDGVTATWSASPKGIVELSATSTTRAADVVGSSVTVNALKAGDVTITATSNEETPRTATFDLHVSDPSELELGGEYTISVGGSKKLDPIDGNYPGKYESTPGGIASATVTSEEVVGETTYELTSLSEGTFYISTSATDTSPSVQLTFESAGNGQYYIKDSTGTYIYPDASRSNYGGWSYNVANGKIAVSVAVSNNNRVIISRTATSNGSSRTVYLRLSSGKLTVSISSQRLYLYTKHTTTGGWQSTITFTGNTVGDAKIVIGDKRYIIHVVDTPENALTGDLTLEYWITNFMVYDGQSTSTNHTKTISASSVQTDEEIAIADIAPEHAYSFFDGTKDVYYWQAVRLDADNTQTTDSGDDETMDGTTLTHVRYHNSAWQYKTTDGVWHYFQSTDQLVAYYLQKTTVTKDVETFVKDWGYAPDSNPGVKDGQCALTIAIVYPDGTLQPAEGSLYSDATTIFNYWSNRDIGIVAPKVNEYYNISKMTVTDGVRKQSSSSEANKWDTSDSITWNKVPDDNGAEWYDETEIWNKSSGTAPMVNGKNSNITWSAKDKAKLVLIYLEPVQKDTNLKLVYWDDSHNVQINPNEIQIAMTYTAGGTVPSFKTALTNNKGQVIGTDDLTGKIESESNYLPDDAYVLNAQNVKQTFNKDVTKVPNVAPQYKSGIYKYNGAVVSEDGTTLTLHYIIDNAKLSHTYILDFGLSVNIPLTDLVMNPEDIDQLQVSGKDVLTAGVDTAHGVLTYDKTNQSIVYTMNRTFDESGALTANFKVVYKDSSSDNKFIAIGVIPASNVLYEENFLTPESNDWTLDNSSTPTAAQETQKLDAGDKATYNVFGTDGAYANAVGDTGVWKAGTTDNPLSTKKPTGLLTTTFYGNAFDLIGNCGVDTGRVVMIISPVGKNSGARTRILDIDTRYNKGTLNQVPLAHVVLDKDAEYKVEIMASGLDAKTVTPTNASAVAVMSAPSASADELLLSVVRRYGLSMANVERISVNDTFPAASVSTASVSAVSDAAMFAEPQADSIKYQQGTHVEIDSFRVYRTADEKDAVAQNYPAAEQNITYWNILDVLQSQTITAYTENGNLDKYNVDTYEALGGPQNEIYIGANQAIAFKIADVNSIQVSLRAVDKTATWADGNGKPYTLNTNTEMYYTIDSVGDVFTIANNTDQLLAIGNVKLGKDVDVTDILPASEIDEQVLLENLRAAFGVSSVEPEPELFQPSTFDAKVSSVRLIRNKLVTIRISVSSDVSYVTVNGVKYWPGRLTRWQKTGYVQFLDTIGRYESKTYTIVAYDANGVASAPITVNG